MSKTNSYKRNGSKGIRALRKAGTDFRVNFSEGTSRIADVILDKSVEKKKDKLAKVKNTSLSFMKDLVSGLRRDLKEVKFVEVLGDVSYEVGKLSALGKDATVRVWDSAMQKLDEDKS